MDGRFLFLGTSGSLGVPIIGCKCSVCVSISPRNKRRRCSALIAIGGKKLLIDAGPEIRQQLLDAEVDAIDGALITHAHYDHVAGIDDLKAFTFAQKKKLPILLSRQTYDEVTFRSAYLMETVNNRKQGIHFDFQVLDDLSGIASFAGLSIQPISYIQVGMPVTGFKIGNLAYLSDIKEYTPQLIQSVLGVDVLIVSALRYTASPMHLSVDEAIALARKIGAKQTYFTHMSHEIDYTKGLAHLPEGIAFAYDGLAIPFSYDKGIP